ncbi:ornithine carbamoyltransferase [Sphingomonas sp. LY29]|uniref:ornithine carbamoyltransferase n=1 Tax=Sphingomonas sp. LY29 TaxID=3095341 RepID=UPI002D76DC22|nr:ornithine carbamoyltransferase [Sphingomonas sp. LY29]WRP25805.1 ornithine carbamoyltransferase [Sphingomonas sp. LY29]
MTTRRFLNLADAGSEGIAAILADAAARKSARNGWPKGRIDQDRPLDGAVLAMIFEKNSTRTRASFDLAIRQLGGSSLILDSGSSQLGRGETIADTARVLSRYADAIMIRTDHHHKGEELADFADVPVINGLTDLSHPCQLLADMQTVIERQGPLVGTQWAWLGDGNNVCNSLIEAAGLTGFDLTVACPIGYEPDATFVEAAGSRVRVTSDPDDAVAGATVVITDTWTSMGQDGEEERQESLAPFQVDEARMAAAAPGATFLHCLPAHRGEEVTDAVLDGPASAAWDAAENRLHAQKSLLLWAMGKL